MKSCVRCGAPMEDNKAFCSKCGSPVLQTVTVRVVTGNQMISGESGSKIKIAIAAVLVLLLISAGYLWFSRPNSDDDRQKQLELTSQSNRQTNAAAKSLEKQLELASQNLKDKQYDKAISAYSEALEMDPKNLDAQVGLAVAYIGQREFIQAEGVISKARPNDAISPEQYKMLITAYIDQGRSTDARKLLAEAQERYLGSEVLDEIKKSLDGKAKTDVSSKSESTAGTNRSDVLEQGSTAVRTDEDDSVDQVPADTPVNDPGHNDKKTVTEEPEEPQKGN